MSGYPTPSNTSGSRTSSSEYELQVKRRRVQDDRAAGRTTSPESPMALEGYSLQKFRVGLPPLQILPLETTPIPDDNEVAVAVWENWRTFKFTCTVRGIPLDGVGSEAFEFVYRTVEDQAPAAEHMTLCVKALWSEGCSESWLQAASAIRGTLRGNPITRAVRVEMISWQLTRPRFTEALEDDHPIVGAWPQIQPQIHSILGQSPIVRDSWQTIVVLRRGYITPESEDNWSDEPDLTSVVLLIVMSYDINPWQWAAQEHGINQLLLQHGLSIVQVEFERGSNYQSVFTLRPPIKQEKTGDVIEGPYDFSIGLGADCGPARYFEQAPGRPIAGPYGTVGGLVTVTKANGTHKKMAMLNYHVARDVFKGMTFATAPNGDPVRADVPDNSELDFIDRNGLPAGPQDRGHMLLESPSRRKHNYTMQKLANDIETIRVELNAATDPAHVQDAQARLTQEQKKYNDKKRFFDENKHNLGTPWLASGFMRRTSYNGRLDWALIQFDDDSRVGSNTMPPREHWPNPATAPYVCAGRNLRDVTSCNNVAARGEVFKVGSRTGFTRGKYSKLKADVNFPLHDVRYGMKSSSEHCFIYSGNLDRAFADRGDSGSWFWTRGGEFMAQFHGGPKTETMRPGSLMYATDAVDLFEDMNEVVGKDYKITLAMD